MLDCFGLFILKRIYDVGFSCFRHSCIGLSDIEKVGVKTLSENLNAKRVAKLAVLTCQMLVPLRI